jgi:predicted adenine nucleotide alpha hydrolase (AANH) superfamily ATPase
MRLLLHICCENCGLYPLNSLSSRGIDVKGYWFNPNIHPEDEYLRRLDALRRLEGLWGLDIEYEDRYGRDEFEKAVRENDGIRCEACYEMRLRETAGSAKKMGLDGFTTTLFVSPYQKFDLIVDTGRRIQEEYNIPFHEEDFRGGWNEGVRMSRQLGLYRQNYCGCIYSKIEREEQKRMKNAQRDRAHR